MNSALLEAFADVDASPEFRDAVLAYFGERRSSTPYPLATKLDDLWRTDAAKARRLATKVLSLVDWAAFAAPPGSGTTDEERAQIGTAREDAERHLRALFPSDGTSGPFGIRWGTYSDLTKVLGATKEATERLVAVLTFGDDDRAGLVALLREKGVSGIGGSIGSSEVDVRLGEVVLDVLGTRDPALVLPRFLGAPQFAMLERLCAVLFPVDLPLFSGDTYNRTEAVVFRLAQGAPDLLQTLFPDLLESWSFVLPEPKWRLTDFMVLDQDEVVVGASEFFQIRRFGRCVVSRTGKHRAGGRISAKTHKTEAAAKKDYDKKRALGVDKLNAPAAPYSLRGPHESHGISTQTAAPVTDPDAVFAYACFRAFAGLAARARKEGATATYDVPRDAKHTLFNHVLGQAHDVGH